MFQEKKLLLALCLVALALSTASGELIAIAEFPSTDCAGVPGVSSYTSNVCTRGGSGYNKLTDAGNYQVDASFECSDSSCTSCSISTSATYGSCVPVPSLETSFLSYPLESSSVTATTYSDSGCKTLLASSGNTATYSPAVCSAQPASVTAVTGIQNYVAVGIAVPTSSSASPGTLFAAGCNSECSACPFVGIAPPNTCTLVNPGETPAVYVLASSAASLNAMPALLAPLLAIVVVSTFFI